MSRSSPFCANYHIAAAVFPEWLKQCFPIIDNDNDNRDQEVVDSWLNETNPHRVYVFGKPCKKCGRTVAGLNFYVHPQHGQAMCRHCVHIVWKMAHQRYYTKKRAASSRSMASKSDRARRVAGPPGSLHGIR